MNDCDMILMTFRMYISLIAHFFFYLWLVGCIIYISFSRSFSSFSFSSGICSCILSIHTVDRWVVFDTIYIHSGTAF